MSLSVGAVAALGLLGGLGAASRFVVDDFLARRLSSRWAGFPLSTLIINVTGSLLIGLLVVTAARTPTLSVLAATGFCGGYTTFSTAMVESVRLLREDDWRRGVLVAAAHLLLCVGAAALGLGLRQLIG